MTIIITYKMNVQFLNFLIKSNQTIYLTATIVKYAA